MYGVYLCYIMILGDNSHFPHLFGINPAEPENPFFHVFDFQGAYDVQMTSDPRDHFLEGRKSTSQETAKKEARGGF